MLFCRKSETDELLKALFERLGPVNDGLKHQMGMPKHIQNVLWYQIFFETSVQAFAEALQCLKHKISGAAVIMCRVSIESALYSSVTRLRPRDLSVHMMRDDSALLSDNQWPWRELKKNAIQLEILNEREIIWLEQLREAGHFAAHIGIKQDASQRKWEQESESEFMDWRRRAKEEGHEEDPQPAGLIGFKRETGQEEALAVAIDTKELLVRIIKNFFSSPKTLADI